MPVYLDYNATAPAYPEVIARMQELLGTPLNASSVHASGRAAKRHLEDARKALAGVLSAWPDEIIFTGSATEANVTALHSAPDFSICVSAIEHASVLKNVPEAMIAPVNENGIINIESLEVLLRGPRKPQLVSVMLANNETGIIQPISEVAALCKKYQALLHCDAVQGLGKIPLDFGMLGADMMTISSHKCGGPVGAAALVIRRGLDIPPLLAGGGQEMRKRAGTENIAAIAGFALAAQKAAELPTMGQLAAWRDSMESSMLKAQSGTVIVGKNAPRLPNTSLVIFPELTSEVQLMNLDLEGYAVSAGAACSSGRIEPSHVLAAMNIKDNLAASAIRISSGWQTSEQEIAGFTEAWKKLSQRLQPRAAAV